MNVSQIQLGQLETGVAIDGVPQLFSQSPLLLVVGQLEKVEAGGGGRQAIHWILSLER